MKFRDASCDLLTNKTATDRTSDSVSALIRSRGAKPDYVDPFCRIQSLGVGEETDEIAVI
jgi:hypothetical protein